MASLPWRDKWHHFTNIGCDGKLYRTHTECIISKFILPVRSAERQMRASLPWRDKWHHFTNIGCDGKLSRTHTVDSDSSPTLLINQPLSLFVLRLSNTDGAVVL
ncbi:hypothetical protein J6590_071736 [Homalodisca vitripennis]|nr:hypothetical protein J6590_071736 [Homalodisca vitripennis]